MAAYLTRRLLWAPFVLLAVSFITFWLGQVVPGDPVQARLGPRANPDAVARERERLGLDQPIPVQYVRYIGGAIRGDFGESIKIYPDREVGPILGERIWRSAQVSFLALLVAFVIGIPLGTFVAMRQGSWISPGIIGFSLIGYSLPTLVLAPIVLYALSYRLRLLPAGNWQEIPIQIGPFEIPFAMFQPGIIMPVIVLAIGPVAVVIRQTRSAVLAILGEDFVRTARAKGLAEWQVLTRHVLRNALIPLVTIIGLSLATLVEGNFIMEPFFGVPGVGKLGVDALFGRDYPIIVAMGLILAAAYFVANTLVDISYAFIDPRIRYE
ncbi:MAG TPA: ABC transporter permease [Dehalococcoidia bacterium]|nr:ABC transporter permease [Dehalococcoidia bacterium]